MSTKQLPTLWLLLLAGAALILGGCATVAPPTPLTVAAGGPEAVSHQVDPEAGLLLFNEHCLECHTATLPRTFVGPSLANAGERLTSDQIRVSIESPGALVASEFAAAMPDNFAGQLSEQELTDIVAYIVAGRP